MKTMPTAALLALLLSSTMAIAHEGAFSAGEPGNPKKPSRVVQVTMRDDEGTMRFEPVQLTVRKGEQVRVLPGESIVVDGEVLEGESEVDESWLTGESLPQRRSVGARVLAGSLNRTSPLLVVASQVGEATRLATIRRLMERAAGERPQIVEQADRVAARFIAALMLRLPRFGYLAPRSLEDAIRLRVEHLDSSMYVAGGTDVFPKMKRRQFQPRHLISIAGVVDKGFMNGNGLRIGAGATLTQVSAHPTVREGYRALADGIGPWFLHLVLPTVTLGLAYVALIARMTRASMQEVLEEDYIRTANAKGVPARTMLMKHALKNASVPIITVIGIGVALLIGGVVITETVFNIPGVGRLVVDAISKRDYPIIQGVILIFSGVYVLINLAVDLSYSLIDPRIRH